MVRTCALARDRCSSARPRMKITNLFLLLIILAFSTFSVAQRLPETSVPENYRVTLTPNFDKDNFGGDEMIQIRVLKPSPSIFVNSLDIDYQEATITSGGTTHTAKNLVDKQKHITPLT